MREKKPRKKKRVELRHNAREVALQQLYQWSLNPMSADAACESCLGFGPALDSDQAYLELILRGTIDHCSVIDAVLVPVLDRDLDALMPVELAVLRLAIYELMYCLDVPYKVVINEALELSKAFGSQDGYKYINGVLHNLAPTLRDR